MRRCLAAKASRKCPQSEQFLEGPDQHQVMQFLQPAVQQALWPSRPALRCM